MVTTQPADSIAVAPRPPGPRLPMTVQTILWALLRHRLLAWAHHHYGPVFRLRVLGRRVVCLTDADLIQTVFRDSVTKFLAGKGNETLKPLMGEQSVLTTDEDRHRRLRALLMPHFQGAALRGYRVMVRRLAEQEVDSWPVGKPVDTQESMVRLTLEVILRVVFGVDEDSRHAELRREVRRLTTVGLIDVFGWVTPPLQRFGRWRRNVEQLRRVDDLLHAEIAHRRTVPDLAERTDVLSRLLSAKIDGAALTDDELRDQLITLLLAGHETTATAVAWTFHELAWSRRVLAAGMRAVDEGDDTYLRAIFKEVMRLRPVIYEAARIAAEPVVIGGYQVEAGTTVTPVMGVVQADPSNHGAPKEFRPERFMDGSAAAGAWMPFGGGIRRCLGAELAVLEATEVLRVALGRYQISPSCRRPERIRPRHVTLAPSRGAGIVLTPRSPSRCANSCRDGALGP